MFTAAADRHRVPATQTASLLTRIRIYAYFDCYIYIYSHSYIYAYSYCKEGPAQAGQANAFAGRSRQHRLLNHSLTHR